VLPPYAYDARWPGTLQGKTRELLSGHTVRSSPTISLVLRYCAPPCGLYTVARMSLCVSHICCYCAPSPAPPPHIHIRGYRNTRTQPGLTALDSTLGGPDPVQVSGKLLARPNGHTKTRPLVNLLGGESFWPLRVGTMAASAYVGP